jgi:hypothetical protein
MHCNRLQIRAPKSLVFMPIPVGLAMEGDPLRRLHRPAIDGGGCARLALTDEDKTGRDLLVGWMKPAVGACPDERWGKIGTVMVALDVPDFNMPKLEELDTVPDKGANGIDLQAAALSKAVDKSKLN